MDDAMVTGRMAQEKKAAGNAVLARVGLNASAAIGLMYDRLIEEQDASFLLREKAAPTESEWRAAAAFVESLVVPRTSKYHAMSKGEVKLERFMSKGA